MDYSHILRYLGHLIAALLFGWFIVTGVRWVWRRSQVLGIIVATGILARVVAGLALYWISYLELPFAEALQAGGGFWKLAADAEGYYQLAALVVSGAPIQEASVPSPFFIKTLALWMSIVGVSPLAGMFLNLCLYVALVFLVVWYFAPANNWRRDLPCIVGISAYTFSPVILIHGTQPLKDELFNILVVTACVGTLGLAGLMYGRAREKRVSILAGTVTLSAAAYGVAGIRWYYGLILWCSLALVFAFFAVRGRTTRLLPYLAGSGTALLTVWLGFAAGAGPYYRAVGMYAFQFVTVTQLSRTGFLMSGGGTNLVVPLREDVRTGQAHMQELVKRQLDSPNFVKEATREQAAATINAGPGRSSEETRKAQLEAARAIPVTVLDQLSTIVTGLAIIFVPLTLVTELLGITIPGGRGLLSIADLDTVFQDITILIVLVLLWKRRDAIGDRLPLVVFALVLSTASAVLLGYVVTNFGTLWRLRSLVAVPIWVAVMALSSRGRQSHVPA